MTKYFLNRLSVMGQYDLLGALRGPDLKTNEMLRLKQFITGRVRAIAFGRTTNVRPGTVRPVWTTRKLTESDIAEVRHIVSNRITKTVDTEHILGHLADAVKASKGHPIWDKRAADLLKALGR